MSEQVLKAETRSSTGKGVARKLRAAGRVPGVLYGRGIEPVSVAVSARELGHTLHTGAGRNVLINLEVDGASHLTLPRHVERHPLRGDVLHIDFMKVSRDEAVTVDVSVHFEGESRGVKEGGLLEHHLWQLHVECLPTNVPDRISVDISNLGIGEVVHVSDITAPEGVKILTSPEEIVVTCVLPSKAEEPAAGGEAPAEGVAGGGEGAPAAPES